MFAGVERVLRSVDRDSAEFSVAILDVTRVDTINDPARALLASMSTTLRAAGKNGFLVDPDAAVIVPGRGFDDVVLGTIDDAVAAAQDWLGSPAPSIRPKPDPRACLSRTKEHRSDQRAPRSPHP